MKRFLPLLILTGLLFGQDVLHLKSGESYNGTFIRRLGFSSVVFQVEGENDSTKFPMKDVAMIKTSDGDLTYPFDVPKIANDAKNNSLTLEEEYQKLSTKEKAIYDANLYNLKHWVLYGPTLLVSTSIFVGYVFWKGSEVLESPITLGGGLAASLSIPYLVFNREENFYFHKSIMTDSEKEIYMQAYSKRLKGRKINYIVGSTIVTGVILVYIVKNFSLDFRMRVHDVRFE